MQEQIQNQTQLKLQDRDRLSTIVQCKRKQKIMITFMSEVFQPSCTLELITLEKFWNTDIWGSLANVLPQLIQRVAGKKFTL